MKYTIYSTTTGQILQQTDCSESAIELQCHHWPTGDTVSYVSGSYSSQLYRVVAGVPVPLPACPGQYYVWDYIVNEWVADTTTAAAAATTQRNDLLSASDWTQIPNGPLTALQQQAWATYRQQLRDITDQPGYPMTIEWPVAPQ